MKVITAILITAIFCLESSVGQYENSANLCTKRCKCAVTNRVLYLDCIGVDMHSTIAEWPKEAENVSQIWAKFDRNRIETLKPLPSTDAAVMLFFTNAQIARLEPSLFINTPNLINLDLSYNRITSDQLSGEVFRGPYNSTQYEPSGIKYLNLAGNGLHKIPKNAFEHLINLRMLDLSHNKFFILDVITERNFWLLENLQHLNLAYNNMQHLNRTILNNQSISNLKELDLSHNQLTLVPKCIKDFASSLEFLKLDNNPIVELTAEDFKGMPKLVHLSLSHLYKLVEIKDNAFNSSGTGIKVIDLSHMNRKCIMGSYIFGPTLRGLNISHSHLEVLPPNWMNYSQLIGLDIKGNQLFCTCDLYNISQQIPQRIKRFRDGPYCFDRKRYRRFEIYTLTDTVCFDGLKYLSWAKSYNTATDARILRMFLLSGSVVLVLCIVVVIWLGYHKFTNSRLYRNRSPFSRTTNVVYNPITSIQH